MKNAQDLYLDLMKKNLCNLLAFEESAVNKAEISTTIMPGTVKPKGTFFQRIKQKGQRSLAKAIERRFEGKDIPTKADTMIGLARLNNIQQCVTTILADDIPGDLIETGVWRGGATIFMKALLEANGDLKRVVWVADSFEGLPAPDEKYPADKIYVFHEMDNLKVGLEEVQANFRKYNLLDNRVQFIKGWFEETLHNAPIEKLSLLRLDGDMYSSTISSLEALYHKVSPGGFVIIDDYGAVGACSKAVSDFRQKNGISDPIIKIDWTGVYWRKTN